MRRFNWNNNECKQHMGPLKLCNQEYMCGYIFIYNRVHTHTHTHTVGTRYQNKLEYSNSNE